MAFAQIDQYFIERFHLLTRNEIIVYCYLVRKQNADTKQCDPRQKKIAAETGLAVSRVSEAVKGLEDKGWIFGDPQGNYLLFDEVTESVKKVTTFVKKVTESVSPEVTEFVSKVTEFVSESYGIRNSHIKELKRQGKDKKKTNTLCKGGRIPEDFYPSEKMLLFAREKLPDDDIENRIVEFRNYWFNATKGAIKKDWDRAFQNRILQILDWQQQRNKNGQSIQRTTNGFSQPSTKPSNAEIIRSRDYSEWAEFDPVAEFG